MKAYSRRIHKVPLILNLGTRQYTEVSH